MSSAPSTAAAPPPRSREDKLAETLSLLQLLARERGLEVITSTPPTGLVDDLTDRCLHLTRALAHGWVGPVRLP